MSTGQVPTLIEAPREPFVSGWTGVLTVGLILYTVATILATVFGVGSGRNTEIFTLFSDAPASVGAAILAALAAYRAQDPSARRTWQLLAASLTVYSHRQPAEFRLLALWTRSVPVDRRRLLHRVLSAGVRGNIDRHPRWRRARALGSPCARQHDPDAGLRRILLVLRDSADGRGAMASSDVLKYVLSQTYIALNCLMVLAFGVLLMNAGSGPLGRRTLMLLTLGFCDHVPGRHRLGHVESVRRLPARRALRRRSTCPATSGSWRRRANSCAVRRR